MSTSNPTETLTDPAPARPSLGRTRSIYAVVLALFLSGLTVVAADPTLAAAGNQLGPNSPFQSAAAQLTFLRVTAGAWALVLSVLQALVLAVLLGAVGRIPRPRLGLSWYWVLLSQIPFLMTVAILQILGGAGLSALTIPWVRIAFGVAGVAIYAWCARLQFRPDPRRLALFCLIAVVLNSALLLVAQR